MGVAAPDRTARSAGPGGAVVSARSLVGVTVASTGGPLALVGLYVPGAIRSPASVGLIVLLAVVAFAAPVVVWSRYSEEVVSSGGLYSFVEAAAGRRAARLQGAVWVVAYALYLPYTITYIVYDLLPVVYPGVRPYRAVLEVILPLAVVGLGMLRLRAALAAVAALAAGQVLVLALLWLVGTAHLGAPAGTLALHGAAGPVIHGAADTSLLFVCASLPLFFGGEVIGGGRAMRRGLVIGTALATGSVLLGATVWTAAGPALLGAPIPGVALARAAGGGGFADLVGLGVVGSIGGVVVAEYFALGRVLHAMSGRSLSRTTGMVAAGFVAASFLSLINPDAFYNDLVKPSLVALWISQLMVFVVYPLWAARRRRLTPGVVAVGGFASALMAYGLYAALTTVVST